MYTKHCPIFVGSDVLTLSSQLQVRRDGLYDRTIDTVHSIASPGIALLRCLEVGIDYASLEQVATYHHIQSEQVADLLGFLNLIGGIRRKRDIKGYCAAIPIQALGLFMLWGNPALTYRRPHNPLFLMQSIMAATAPVTATGIIVAGLAYGGGLTSLATSSTYFVYTAVLFIGSLYVHEYIYIGVCLFNNAKADIVQQGMRLGVIHKQLPLHVEYISALCGPLSGIIWSYLYWSALPFKQPSYIYITTCIAIINLLGLLPWFGDGKTLWRSLLQKRIAQ